MTRTGLSHLDIGRRACESRAWDDAYKSLLLADRAAPLKGEDLERLALSAYLVGQDEDYLRALERVYHTRLDTGHRLRAVRCAFWLGLRFLFRGESGRANGWLARARRLLAREKRECAERGYLLLPAVEQHSDSGVYEAAYAAATEAGDIGERCGEPDLIACARHLQGRVRIQQGRVQEGLAFLDEAMVAVGAGELSPIMTGLIYCSVIEAFQQVYALARAREWTAALAAWCAAQPQMVAFAGVCQVHRAEILQLGGAWDDAAAEARRAGERSQGTNRQAAAAALYQQAEVHRLRGEFEAAERAYRDASQSGLEPQPGLALLRLGQGRAEAAAAAMRRALAATQHRLQRTRLLPAQVEIAIAVGDLDGARSACTELGAIAAEIDTEVLRAVAAYAKGAVELAAGEPQAALAALRQAFESWQSAGIPYEIGRTRRLIGLACRTVGDEDGTRLELEAASALFATLGAAPDLASTVALLAGGRHGLRHPLSRRELEVLRLIATGKTNKAIAARLSLSEKTVDRHVSNILTKLAVPSRTAATAYAYEHKIL